MSIPQINFISFQPATASQAIGAAPDQAAAVPLVLLHGWGHSINNLRQLGELLGETNKVYLLDLPGFGQSPEPESVWGTAEYADAIIKFLDQQGLGQVDLFGHSFGGRISIQLAAANPERVRRLILCSSAGLRLAPSLTKKLRLQAIKNSGAALKAIDRLFKTELFKTRFAPRFGSADYKRSSGTMRNILVRTINEDLADLLPAVRSEALLLWGRLDMETPLAAGERMHALIPRSELIILDNHGHEPFLGIGSHLLTYYCTPFLERGCAAIEALRGERWLVP